MTTYYFFDEYGECIDDGLFPDEEWASGYADMIGADYFCSDED
jgi:hypothetical protein